MSKIRYLVIINDEARATAARVVAHADQNHYYPETGASSPGDDEYSVAKFGSYRTVFSFTHYGNSIYRHLSVSIPWPDWSPNPVAVFMIADLFGFTGYDRSRADDPPKDWTVGVCDNPECNCLVVVQPCGFGGPKEMLQ
jgi:hypothetical protein